MLMKRRSILGSLAGFAVSLALVAVGVIFASINLGPNTGVQGGNFLDAPALALTQLQQKAANACNQAQIIDGQDSNGNIEHPDCEDGYVAGYDGQSTPSGCENGNGGDPGTGGVSACDAGYKLGEQAAPGGGATGSSSAPTAPPSYVSPAVLTQAGSYCNSQLGDDQQDCASGYEWGITAGKKPGNCNASCVDGYDQGVADLKAAPSECTGDNGANLLGCEQGVKAKQAGQPDPCSSLSGSSQTSCETGFTKATAPASTTTQPSEDACDADPSAGVLGWILCPVIQVINKTIGEITTNVLEPELLVSPYPDNASSGTSSNPYEVWNALRTFADVLFVLVFMVIIFANTIGLNVETYTIKKMLPKLAAAAILVQFSFVLSSAIIDISNVLGGGIGVFFNIILKSVPSHQGQPSFIEYLGGVGLGGLFAVGAIAAIGVPTIVIAVIGALISVVGIMFTLIARKLIILILVITSPIAFVAWTLPNTERIFKMWLNNFIKVAMMYPIIMFILAAASVATAANSGSGGFQGLLGSLFPIIAFCMIPMTFKWAGSAMGFAGGKISGLTGKARSGATSGLKNSRWKESMDKNRAERKLGKLDNALAGGNVLGSARLGRARQRWAGLKTIGDPSLRTDANGNRVYRNAATERRALEREHSLREHGLATNMDVRRRSAREEELSSIEKALAGASKSEVQRSFDEARAHGDSTSIIGTARHMQKNGMLEQSHIAQVMDALRPQGADAQFGAFETIMQGDFAGMKKDHGGMWSAWAQMAGSIDTLQRQNPGMTREQAIQQASQQQGGELLRLTSQGPNANHLLISGSAARSFADRSADQLLSPNSDGFNGLADTTLAEDVVDRNGTTVAAAGENIAHAVHNDRLWEMVEKPAVASKINGQSRRFFGLGVFERAKQLREANPGLDRDQALIDAAQARAAEINANPNPTQDQLEEMAQMRRRIPGAGI
jgi:hypothetical protein